MVGTVVKVAALGAGAVLAWRYLIQPWRARRAATNIVKVTGKATGSAMKQALADVVAALAKMKVTATVGTGSHGGEPAVLVKPDNKALRVMLIDKLPDYVHGVRVAVV